MDAKTAPGSLRKRDSHLWARDPDDWYVEPAWCSTRLFELEKFSGTVWDPAAGTGRIVSAARLAGYDAIGSDIVLRTVEDNVMDFFTVPVRSYNQINIVSNPPFKTAERFAKQALEISHAKVALLLPATWLVSDKRGRWLETTPLARVLFITPRPSMPPGAVVAAGVAPGNGTTDYAWYIWEHGHKGPWLGSWCRR